MTIFSFYFVWFFLVFSGCSHFCPEVKERKWVRTENAVLWFQNAGEVRALQYQAFNVAKLRLDQDLRREGNKGKGKQRAVVVDVDETVLDNSPYQARVLQTDKGYPTGWHDWITMAEATPIPGAVKFLRYAKRKGVAVFYITNRKDKGSAREATLKNLRGLGFPVEDDHVMLRTHESSKRERRSKVLEKYRIVLLIGDNLGDFDDLFEGKISMSIRNRMVDKNYLDFGKRFIVVPNPMYGDWERAIYKGRFDLPEARKKILRKKALRSY